MLSPEGVLRPFAVFQCDGELDVAVTQRADQFRKRGVEGHRGRDHVVAPSRNPVERGQVFPLVESVAVGLLAENIIVHRFVVEQELPQEDVAHVLVTHRDRRGDVPHVVLAPVLFERAGRHVVAQFEIALDAQPARLGIHPMESRADLLPAGAHQYLTSQVNDTDADVGQVIESIH